MPDIGWPELIIIVFVLMLLFGAKKLPDMARGTGRALRIFKAETKGLMDDDDPTTGTGATATNPAPPVQITRQPVTQSPPPPEAPVITPVEPLPPTHSERDR
jgi:sec-independent protein translocase protein TatA